jgi:hypothetical protein
MADISFPRMHNVSLSGFSRRRTSLSKFRAIELSSDLQAMQSLGRRIRDLHIPTNAPLALNLSSAERKQLLNSSSTFQSVEDFFAQSAEAAFQSMHQDPWSRFVKLRLTLAQKAFIKRSQRNRDSFCLVGAHCRTSHSLEGILVDFANRPDLREGPQQLIGVCRAYAHASQFNR